MSPLCKRAHARAVALLKKVEKQDWRRKDAAARFARTYSWAVRGRQRAINGHCEEAVDDVRYATGQLIAGRRLVKRHGRLR